MENIKCRGWYWGPVIGYLLFIFYLSSQSQIPSYIPHWWDKFLHFIAYSVLGFLLARARSLGKFQVSWRVLIVWSVCGSLTYGISDEIHQLFVPNREFSFFDMLADLCGGLAGFFYFWSYRYVIQKCGGTKIY